jgi:hypothetical protein
MVKPFMTSPTMDPMIPTGVVGIINEDHPLVSTEAGSHLVFDLLVDHAS